MSDLISHDKFIEFWENEPVVVIDSSSLLDLYRYAPSASKNILKNLKEIQDCIWIPAHVLEEYSENKVTVVNKEHKKFENVTREVINIVKNAESNVITKFHRYGKFKYPNIHTLRNELETIFESLNEKAESFKDITAAEITENKHTLLEDDVSSFIKNLKEANQVGIPLSLPSKIDIYTEGKLRYNHLIPPGYLDADKDQNDSTKIKKFGDLIIWKEILNKSSSLSKPFIFVTDDEKEDWWELKKLNSPQNRGAELLGPRKELISEFDAISKIGKGHFLMLTLPELNSHLSIINEMNVKESFINDIELDPYKVVNDIITSKEWGLVLNGSGDLTMSFIHDGELQDLTGEILTDAEILEYSAPDFDNLYVDYDDNQVIIEGNFLCEVTVDIETSLSKEYREWISSKVLLEGNITIEFNYSVDEVHDIIKKTNEVVCVSNIKIQSYQELHKEDYYHESTCTSCGVRSGSYHTGEGEPVCSICVNEYDICTGCGKLFNLDSLGGYKCISCETD